MARAARPTTTGTNPAPNTPRSTSKPAKAAAKAPVARPPMVSKDELRAQVEKLEQTVATLRAKSREATKAAKASAARIAELEDEVATLEKQVASQAVSAKRSAKRERRIDPGDAVPPGVAVVEPEPLDGEAERALENLEEHLGASGGGERAE